MTPLMAMGVLERTIPGKPRSGIARFGEKAAHAHQRGFEPMQQEQMVLQYVAKHGRITRAEVAELCKLSPDQAHRLLQQLTASNRLTRHGTKKGTWYERRA